MGAAAAVVRLSGVSACAGVVDCAAVWWTPFLSVPSPLSTRATSCPHPPLLLSASPIAEGEAEWASRSLPAPPPPPPILPHSLTALPLGPTTLAALHRPPASSSTSASASPFASTLSTRLLFLFLSPTVSPPLASSSPAPPRLLAPLATDGGPSPPLVFEPRSDFASSLLAPVPPALPLLLHAAIAHSRVPRAAVGVR